MHQVNNIRESSRVLTSAFWTFQCVVCILKQEAAEICCEKGSILGTHPTVVPRRPPAHLNDYRSQAHSNKPTCCRKALALTNLQGSHWIHAFFFIYYHTYTFYQVLQRETLTKTTTLPPFERMIVHCEIGFLSNNRNYSEYSHKHKIMVWGSLRNFEWVPYVDQAIQGLPDTIISV